MDALRYALEEKKADTQDDTLGYIEAETFVEALANTVRKDGGGDSKLTQANVNSVALVEALADTVAEVEIEALSNTLAKVNTKALADALADTLEEVERGTLSEQWLM